MISPDFVFSQNSLQDFLECPCRFQLRHVLRQAWPAAETDDQEQFEHHMEQGQDFHRKVQQYFSGIPVEVITDSIHDELLRTWWDNFLSAAKDFAWSGVNDAALKIRPEYSLSTRLRDHRLTAKYDLIASIPGKQFWIYDWKTSLSIPSPARLEQRIQTRLYRWMLASSGFHLNSGSVIPPEQVVMTYWFAQEPGRQVVLSYDQAQFASDEQDLGTLMDQISSLADTDFVLTDDKRRCRFCPYRSYCDRGFEPGKFSELEQEEQEIELPTWESLEALDGTGQEI